MATVYGVLLKCVPLQYMKRLSRYIDFVFCIVVLPLMAMIFPIERWFHNFPLYVTSVGVWLYALYLVNRIIVVPSFFAKDHRKRYWGMILVVVSVAVTFLFSNVNLYTPKPNIHDVGIVRLFPKIQQYQQAVWSLYMIVTAFSFAVGLLTQANSQRARRLEVETERDKAEIALYKAQIKPHFMVNTLNSLYGLFLTGNKNALVSLERFITLMRYVHQASQCDMVPLADEVEYIHEYVELQSLRLNEMTKVKLDIGIRNGEMMIPPMLLITFVENCFKHGVSPVEESEIKIVLRENKGIVVFSTSNHIFPVRRIGEHMGIENCRRRLGLLYPGRHEFSIVSDDNTFRVNLIIDLNHD